MPGEVYNLVTEADHQLNVLLGPEMQALELGVMLRGVGIHGPDTSVRLSISPEYQLIGEDSHIHHLKRGEVVKK